MNNKIGTAAQAAAFAALAVLCGCGGGGSSGGSTPPPANRAPTLTALALTTDEDTAASAQLAATDPDGNPVSFTLATNAQHGTATVTSSGALSYQPASNYSGTDTIGVTVRDNAGGQSAGTINVTVNPINDAPALGITQIDVDEDDVVNGQLGGTDAEGNDFDYEVLTPAAHGNFTLDSQGNYSYTPQPDYFGADQVDVRLAEPGGMASVYGVNVTVRAVNDIPTAADDSLLVPATGGTVVVLALFNDSDIDGDTLTPEVVTQPRGGTVSVDAGTRQLRFARTNEYVGPIDFSYRINDGTAHSNVATVHAYIGEPQSLLFLSDYTTPGVLELHVFDGLEVRRVSDDLPAGRTISTYTVSTDHSTLAYVLDAADAERVYVKPLDGSAPAALRYTSQTKTNPSERRVSLSLNVDGTYALLRDGWIGNLKYAQVLDTSTGVARRIGGSTPGVVDTRIVIFHPYEPELLLVQGQTSGTDANDLAHKANTLFTASAADPRMLTKIGHDYAAGQCGSGEGIYVGNDSRYIYHGEYLCSSGVINLIAYDRVEGTESYVVRQSSTAFAGLKGVMQPVLADDRMCFMFYEPTTNNHSGPARFYVMDTGDPTLPIAVTAPLQYTEQCTLSGDQRTAIYSVSSASMIAWQVYAVGATNPGTPQWLVPAAETTSEFNTMHVAFTADRVAMAYFDGDGTSGLANGQIGRFYSMPASDVGQAFLFSDNYVPPLVTGFLNSSSDDGAFIAYARPEGGMSALELMSTRGLNLSIPLSRDGETRGVQSFRWLRGSVRIN